MADDAPRLRRLLEVGRDLTEELDRRVVLERLLDAAREITGARYAALGILDDGHTELDDFVTSGIDVETARTIGDLPRGHGVLGVLITRPEPLRLHDVGMHPRSYGFPLGHPEMRTFLGVPVTIRGSTWGNLYLTEKDGGDFTDSDEEAAVILAQWAAIAIENARAYEKSEHRRIALERAFTRIEAAREVGTAISRDLDLDHVLELIAKRGRSLVGARSLVIMLREGEDLVAQASAGYATQVKGFRLPISGSTSGQVLKARETRRIADASAQLQVSPSKLGVGDAQTALLVPLLHHGEAVGVLAAFDHGEEAEAFDEDDGQMLGSFAANAATAVVLARSVRSERLQSSLAAADAERRRWARELHDETLQGLTAVGLLLSIALAGEGGPDPEAAMRETVGQIDTEIENLRAIISELRPAALERLGLKAAVEALLDQHRSRSDMDLSARFEIAEDTALGADLEGGAYRLIQEALTNAVRHSGGETVQVSVTTLDGRLMIAVSDDGDGFDHEGDSPGYGLVGMSERVALAGGELKIDSSPAGTAVAASLPMTISRGAEAGSTSAVF